MNKHTLNIFTRDIIQNSLQAIADEMFAAMRKAAMSPIIYEVLDMGTGITDARGEIASSGAGIPAFVGVLDKAVKYLQSPRRPPPPRSCGSRGAPAPAAAWRRYRRA